MLAAHPMEEYLACALSPRRPMLADKHEPKIFCKSHLAGSILIYILPNTLDKQPLSKRLGSQAPKVFTP